MRPIFAFIIYINKQSFLVQKLEQLLGAALRFDSKNLTHLWVINKILSLQSSAAKTL